MPKARTSPADPIITALATGLARLIASRPPESPRSAPMTPRSGPDPLDLSSDPRLSVPTGQRSLALTEIGGHDGG